MRWIPWLLGIVGVLQYAIIAYTAPVEYVSTDMAYLVMFLCVIGALLLCYMSWGCCGDGCRDWDDGEGHGGMAACDCCDGHCHCGDCDACDPASHGHGDGGHGQGHAH